MSVSYCQTVTVQRLVEGDIVAPNTSAECRVTPAPRPGHLKVRLEIRDHVFDAEDLLFLILHLGKVHDLIKLEDRR